MFQFFNSEQIQSYTNTRDGETKIGQVVRTVDSMEALSQIASQCKYVILGIPEDIGPRANCGFGGAHVGWEAFLKAFCNQQSNVFFDGDNCVVLGQFDFSFLPLVNDLEALRHQCQQLDNEVTELLLEIFKLELTPIVIGGGHNNCFPIIKACSTSNKMPLAVANLDPHSDFRECEGRHSGNGFRYAFEEGFLTRYTVAGLHQQKNNAASLQALADLDFPVHFIQDTHWHRTSNFDQVLEEMAKYLMHSGLPIGIELDMDVINQMPSSAITATSLPFDDALYYVSQMASLPKVSYLHLAEAAPDPNCSDAMRTVGQTLNELVTIFIKSKSKEET